MSLLDTTLKDCDKVVLENYVLKWLNENTYSRQVVIHAATLIQHLEPNIIIHDNNIVDLEYPNKWKMVIHGEVDRIPTKYFKFGKVNCAVSLGENFRSFPGSIESLEGLPTEITGFYDASWCVNLKSLKGLPKIIHGHLYLQGTNFSIKDHIYLPKVIEGDLYININKQEDADIIYKNHLIKGIIVGYDNDGFNNKSIRFKKI